jgi:hypothetical protein
MKIIYLTSLVFAFFATGLFGFDLKDPLLDARLNLFILRTQYRDKSPQVTEARETVDLLSKNPKIGREEHIAAIQERLAEATIENKLAAQKYRDEHPLRVEAAAKLTYLQNALHKAEQASNP